MSHGFWGQKYWVDASTLSKEVCGRCPPPPTPTTLLITLVHTCVCISTRGLPGRCYPPVFPINLELLTLKSKWPKTEDFNFLRLIRLLFWKPKSRNQKIGSSKIEFCGPNIGMNFFARDVYTSMSHQGKIMQNMTNAIKQLKTPAWHRRRWQIGGGGAASAGL